MRKRIRKSLNNQNRWALAWISLVWLRNKYKSIKKNTSREKGTNLLVAINKLLQAALKLEHGREMGKDAAPAFLLCRGVWTRAHQQRFFMGQWDVLPWGLSTATGRVGMIYTPQQRSPSLPVLSQVTLTGTLSTSSQSEPLPCTSSALSSFCLSW